MTHADLNELATTLDFVLAEHGDTFRHDTVSQAKDVLAKVDARLSLGSDFTVVAFAGATGSGKSSLFNAVSGLDIAEVGVRRPTSSKPTACVWGEGGEEILDWLAVPHDQRTWRESALDGDNESSLHGLILIDLPDHDSTAVAHREESDRLVELVDVIFWVVDPQKYADNSTHSRYLQRLAQHETSMVYVLNQIDRLKESDQARVLDHLTELLGEHAIAHPTVLGTSAVTRQGVPELRAILASTCEQRVAAEQRLSADLRGVTATLREELGEPVPDPHRLPGADALIRAMVDAAGISAVSHTVHDDYLRRAFAKTAYPITAAMQKGTADPLGARHGGSRAELISQARPQTSQAQNAGVRIAAHELVSNAVASLPSAWRHAVSTAEHATGEHLGAALDEAVVAVDIDRKTPRWWSGVKFLQWLFFILTVLGVVAIAVPLWMMFGAQADVTWWHWALPAVLVVTGAVGSFITSTAAAGARRRGAQEAASAVSERLLAAVRAAASSSFMDPVTDVLIRHKELCERLRD